MKPTFFAHANNVMKRPERMTDEECSDLSVYRDDKQVISCWQPTNEERTKIAMGAPVYVYVFGQGMPPLFISADDPWGATE